MTDAILSEVLEHEQRRWDALIAKDLATLDDLFAEELAYTHSNAMVDTRDSYLRAIAERTFDYASVRRSDEEARLVGDVVLLTGRAEVDVTVRGRAVQLDNRYSVVWVQRDGRWQFLCWQSTPIPG